ncbi:MAG TPA: SDR family NAD(P)-dependent oxidoreductase, partial [Polyangiales bacterium]|nr:SDR family NAD(P)-dependent oxidoreductase [Polyangiales bacterium]
LPLDLADFTSIRAFVASVLARREPLHLLINNAGVAGSRGMTASGFERTFGVNHVGTFLLTKLLTDHLVRTSAAGVRCRIVTVASKVHVRCTRFGYEGVQAPTRFTGVTEYQHSKLANILFSAELARRLSGTGVSTYSLHPGVVATDIWRAVPWPLRSLLKLRPDVISVEEGAKTTLHCATSVSASAETGLYYQSERVKAPSRLAQDRDLAAELWSRSERWVA